MGNCNYHKYILQKDQHLAQTQNQYHRILHHLMLIVFFVLGMYPVKSIITPIRYKVLLVS